jgi:hypothetical protein
MTGLSNDAKYANWSYAKEGDNISIIEKQYFLIKMEKKCVDSSKVMKTESLLRLCFENNA